MLPPSLLIALLASPSAVLAAQVEVVPVLLTEDGPLVHTQSPPQIRLESGRVTLLELGQRKILIGQEPPMEAPRAAHLEAGAGASVRLTWAGRASLHLKGPASLEWMEAADGTPEWHVFSAGSLNLEVRRGEPLLHLPGDWRTEIQGSSALYLETGTDGVAWIDCDAGAPLAFRWFGDASRARPAVFCAPGTSIRLGEPPEPEERALMGRLPAWERAAWAWPEWSESALPEVEEPQPTSLSAALRRHSMHSRAIAKADPELPLPVDDPQRGQRTQREGGPGAEVRTASPLRFSARRPIDRLARRGTGGALDPRDDRGAPVVIPPQESQEEWLASLPPGADADGLHVQVQPGELRRPTSTPGLDLPAPPQRGAAGRELESLPQPGALSRDEATNPAVSSPRAHGVEPAREDVAESPASERTVSAPPEPDLPKQPARTQESEALVTPEPETPPSTTTSAVPPAGTQEKRSEISLPAPVEVSEASPNTPVSPANGLSLPTSTPPSDAPVATDSSSTPEVPDAEREELKGPEPARGVEPAETESSATGSAPTEPASNEIDSSQEAGTPQADSNDPEPEVSAEPEKQPEPPKEPAVFHVQDWHYLKRDRIKSVGGFAVQDHPAVEVEAQAGDLWRITLRADASANAWVFGTRKDLLLRPGAVVVLQRDGSLDAHFGRVRFDDVPEWRPTWEEIAPRQDADSAQD